MNKNPSACGNSEELIPFARPAVGKDEEEAVLRVLRSGWITTGAEALAFEGEFAAFLSESREDGEGNGELPSPPPLRALAVNSATAGLHLALEALGVGPGDVVLVPSYTFAASAEVALYLGAEAAFVDVKRGSFSMDAEKLEEAVVRLREGKSAQPHGGAKGRARAIVAVHFAGLPCDIGSVARVAEKYGLSLVEDAAHSFPAWIDGGNGGRGAAGTAGDVGVFSFYATKTITTGEGGMAVTRNEALAKRMSVMRLHGIDRPVWDRYSAGGGNWRYEIVAAGCKYNLCDILAAIGRVQLRRANELLAERKRIADVYDEAFGADGRFILPPTAPGDARHLYPLRLGTGTPPRDDVIDGMRGAGIGVSVHFIPLHTMPFYKKRYNLQEGDFPETMKAFSAEVSLPLWPGMSDGQIEKVIKTTKNVCR
ncbi:MAG: DegT/DnrJ/EryC1/StrS aminotransferase family protein [Spirochaetaceae bacterium]|jgi:dTDP-4-amino-4,6-dideoxygalactose transaminase|nr:DegT/DnrJ/EryC1/StrS aminotransferase family protein [Spirochaetaceae bacterium]